MDELQRQNARAVVAVWRRNEHTEAWGPRAVNRNTSELIHAGASAWSAVQRCVADQIMQLELLGFMSTHDTIRTLRDIEVKAASSAISAEMWAKALREAERT